MRLAFYSLVVVFLLSALGLEAQELRINEVMASNSTLVDEDGDTPDWIELYNPSDVPVAMEGWSLTDNIDIPDKWVFPPFEIAKDDFLFLWASGKDRKVKGSVRTLINQGDIFRYLIPAGTVDNEWSSLNYNDSNWQQSESGFGYGDGDDQTTIPRGTRSIFLRKKFTINRVEQVEQLILHMDYDDGFVAYINGIEIARANIEGSPPRWNQTTITDHEAQIYESGKPDKFLIENIHEHLVAGENVLSIQAHNISTSSSDFTIIPFLSIKYNVEEDVGIIPPDILELRDSDFHANFKISSKGETIYLFDNGDLIDSLLVENVPPDYSVGRLENSETPVIFANSTPDAPNDAETFEGVVDQTITFSIDGGSIAPSSLELSGVAAPFQIKYTLDASEPTSESQTYEDKLSITRTTVVRARVFLEGYLPSPTQTNVYRINTSHELPIVDIVTENKNLYDTETGIYIKGLDANQNFPHFGANFWEDWERPVYFRYDDGEQSVAYDAGVKIFGGWSRGFAQKSLSLFARDRYGAGEFNFPFFKSRDYDKFQALVLRNSGNDWNRTMFRDGMITSLMEGSGLDLQAYQPTVVYLNGNYWGLHNLREKINEHFVASKHNVDPQDVDILEKNGELIFGSNESYLEMIDFVSQQNLASAANYKIVSDQIDIENMIIYQVAQIYFNNTDWPGNNIKYFRYEGGKWRWVLFDTDFGLDIWNNNAVNNNTLAFALNPNGPDWPNPPWSTLLFRKLIENKEYRHKFINRFADEMNTRFLGDNVNEHIQKNADLIKSEIVDHFRRWGGNGNDWVDNINRMKAFANLRSISMKRHIKAQFGLPNHHTITVNNPNAEQGYVRLNSLVVDARRWQGDYFETVPIRLIALPRDGYVFSHWEGASSSTNQEITLDLNEAKSITPIFSVDNSALVNLMINEINYNSSDDHDTGDWIELYNPTASTKDISGWYLRDDSDDHKFVFPEETLIGSGDYMVVVRNRSNFEQFHDDVSNLLGDLNFGLSSDTDQVRLFNNDGVLVDSVHYTSSDWPIEANGNGYTLELTDPSLDNTIAESWANIHEYGSPGKTNLESTSTKNIFTEIDLILSPNPVQDILSIQFRLETASFLELKIYNLEGKVLKQVASREFSSAKQEINTNVSDLPEGLYYLNILSKKGPIVTHPFFKSN